MLPSVVLLLKKYTFTFGEIVCINGKMGHESWPKPYIPTKLDGIMLATICFSISQHAEKSLSFFVDDALSLKVFC